ncbi:MAG: hypothetical protein KDB22_11085 [Planctomycetales bacterium]|nr:hypothetical protein [Planctomycetales bacterium]
MSDYVILWAASILLQVSIIAMIALVASYFLRRVSAIRYWCLCTSLGLILLSPGSSAVSLQSGYSLFIIANLDTKDTSGVPKLELGSAAAQTPAATLDAPSLDPLPLPSTNVAPDKQVNPEFNVRPEPISSFDTVVTQFGDRSIELESDAQQPVVTASVPLGLDLLRKVGTPLLLLWCAGIGVLSVRMVVCWSRLSRLLREAQPNRDAEIAQAFATVWSMLAKSNGNMPTLVFSDRVSGPIAAGICSPKVVLPREFAHCTNSQQLKDTLTHELAHILRSDQIMVLLQNVANALFWVHPLVRAVNQHLAKAREEVCDNYVLAATDAPSYSRNLLALAQLLQSPQTLSGAVGLFTSRWKLEQRVSGLLDEHRSRETTLSKTRFACILGMAGLVGLGVAMTTISLASDSGESNSTAVQVAGEASDEIVVTGVVMRPDNTPAAGAVVHVIANPSASLRRLLGGDFEPPVAEFTTDQFGRFQARISKRPFGEIDLTGTNYENEWKGTVIGASLQGHGCTWVRFSQLQDNESPVLHLVNDVPVRGRVVDLEGNPIPGVVVKAGSLRTSETGDVSEWLDAIRAGHRHETAFPLAAHNTKLNAIAVRDTVVTDSGGRFEMHGLGRDRIIELEFRADQIAFEQAQVVTRQMEPIVATIVSAESQRVFGSDFTLSASPSQVIQGTVLDATTREPLTGVRVEAYKLAGSMIGGRQELSTTTDASGRFRLTGLPKFQPDADKYHRNNYLMFRPNDDQPYFMRQIEVPGSDGLDPVELTAELHRGIWIEGKVVDSKTALPVPGVRMHYLPYRSNEFAKSLPEFNDDGNVDGDETRYQSDINGHYRLLGLPGPAVVGAQSIAKPFCFGTGFDDLQIADNPMLARQLFYSNPIAPSRAWPNAVKRIEPDSDANLVQLDFELDAGATVELEIVDQSDQLVVGAKLKGLSRHKIIRSTEARKYDAINLTQDQVRVIEVHHEDRNLGVVARIDSGDLEKGAKRIVVLPCATVTGTLTDQGKPMSGIRIIPYFAPQEDSSAGLAPVAVDSQGHFEIALLPGARYRLNSEGKGVKQYAVVEDDLSVEPGQRIDLGTLELTKDRKFVPVLAAQPDKEQTNRNTEPAKNSSIRISGTVMNAAQKPIPNAIVAVVARSTEFKQVLLAEGLTDEVGGYQLKLPSHDYFTHQDANIIAVADRMGMSFQKMKPVALTADEAPQASDERVIHDLTLMPEVPIRVRLVDIQGGPAKNLDVRLKFITSESLSNRFDLDGISLKHRPQFGKFESDDSGLLTVTGLIGSQGAWITISGNEWFAPQDVALNMGMSAEREERDGTYRPLVCNVQPGETATVVLSPAQFIEGKVLLGDSDQPAAGVRVTVFSSQQEFGGSMYGLNGTTDNAGRFRINPNPGLRFSVIAHPPAGSPYQSKEVSDVKWERGGIAQYLEIRLPSGVTLHGRVIDADSKEPLVNSYVQYIPDEVHNEHVTPDLITGWQAMQRTDSTGTFEIPVLAGPGTLLVHAPDKTSYVLQKTTDRELDGLSGGIRYYAHAIQKISPAATDAHEPMTIELVPGKTARPNILDSDGKPVDELTVVTPLNIHPYSPFYRGYGDLNTSHQAVIPGLQEGQQYQTSFLNAKRKLGATAVLDTNNLTPSVTLQPCGSAQARFVNQRGEPIANFGGYGLLFVARPGPSRSDHDAMRRGGVVADEDFAANVDRLNHGSLKTDNDGRIVFPALIPGATYRFERGAKVVSEFVAKSGEMYDMGTISVNVPD